MFAIEMTFTLGNFHLSFIIVYRLYLKVNLISSPHWTPEPTSLSSTAVSKVNKRNNACCIYIALLEKSWRGVRKSKEVYICTKVRHRSPAVLSPDNLPLQQRKLYYNIFNIPAGFAVGTRCFFRLGFPILTSFSLNQRLSFPVSNRFGSVRVLVFPLSINYELHNPLSTPPKSSLRLYLETEILSVGKDVEVTDGGNGGLALEELLGSLLNFCQHFFFLVKFL